MSKKQISPTPDELARQTAEYEAIFINPDLQVVAIWERFGIIHKELFHTERLAIEAMERRAEQGTCAPIGIIRELSKEILWRFSDRITDDYVLTAVDKAI